VEVVADWGLAEEGLGWAEVEGAAADAGLEAADWVSVAAGGSGWAAQEAVGWAEAAGLAREAAATGLGWEEVADSGSAEAAGSGWAAQEAEGLEDEVGWAAAATVQEEVGRVAQEAEGQEMEGWEVERAAEESCRQPEVAAAAAVASDCKSS